MQITNDILRLIQHAALFDESEQPPISAELWQQILTADLETPVDIEADTHTIATLLSWARDVYVGQGDVFRGRLALRAIENLRNQPPAAARLAAPSSEGLPPEITQAWDEGKKQFKEGFDLDSALQNPRVVRLAQARGQHISAQFRSALDAVYADGGPVTIPKLGRVNTIEEPQR